MSASSRTIRALFPPSSSDTFLSVLPASSATRRPTCVEPVNWIIWTHGSRHSASPASAAPGITCKTPAGSPASCKARAIMKPPDNGVCGSGFEDDGVARRQCRCHRTHGQDQRKVERRDDADDAARHTARIAQPRRRALQHFAACAERQGRGRMQQRDCFLHFVHSLGGNAARFACNDGSALIRGVLEHRGGFDKDGAALACRTTGPRALSLCSRLARNGDILRVADADSSQGLAVRRIEHFARAARRRDPFTVEDPAVPTPVFEQGRLIRFLP